MPFRNKLIFVVFFVAVFVHLPVAAQKEILCRSSQVRYDRPGECAVKCVGELENERCVLQPHAPALNDVFFVTYYNSLYFRGDSYLHTRSCVGSRQVELTLGAGTQDAAAGNRYISTGFEAELRSKLIERIIYAWFSGYQVEHLQIIWGRDEVKNVGIAVVPKQYGKYPLFISVNLLCKSPAYITASVGHELIHIEQDNRTYNGLDIDDLQIRKVRDALREVEAYEWETGTGYFPWQIKTSNQWLSAMSPVEESELHTLEQCAGWKLESEIEQVRTHPDAENGLKKLKVYFQEDPWVRTNWLPRHSDWALRSAGAEPAACQDPPFAAF
jgi:hypothetical protein